MSSDSVKLDCGGFGASKGRDDTCERVECWLVQKKHDDKKTALKRINQAGMPTLQALATSVVQVGFGWLEDNFEINC